MDITQSTVATSVVGGAAAPGSGRGVLVQLGKVTSVNLNSVAPTNIFTTPAVGGYTRCNVQFVRTNNFSAVATTASVSYGASGTPTDFSATATMPDATATTSSVTIFPASGAAGTGYGIGVSFVANVTIVQGVATTCDIEAWGWYE